MDDDKLDIDSQSRRPEGEEITWLIIHSEEEPSIRYLRNGRSVSEED